MSKERIQTMSPQRFRQEVTRLIVPDMDEVPGDCILSCQEGKLRLRGLVKNPDIDPTNKMMMNLPLVYLTAGQTLYLASPFTDLFDENVPVDRYLMPYHITQDNRGNVLDDVGDIIDGKTKGVILQPEIATYFPEDERDIGIIGSNYFVPFVVASRWDVGDKLKHTLDKHVAAAFELYNEMANYNESPMLVHSSQEPLRDAFYRR